MNAALALAFYRLTGEKADADSLGAVLIFCGLGLLMSLVATICGFDLGGVFL
jgi:hypothetical protein